MSEQEKSRIEIEEEIQNATAERFFNKIMERVQDIDTAYGYLVFAIETKDLIEIAKEFGVDINKMEEINESTLPF